ncbi:hypothetical protein [Streptomyces durocortorensis]|uniref:Integral membrane protein n=1 Tax=Streptomyces durocortorensis TaxID=2811104 RepID=A0ABS2HWX5_9ACTN|nr:hypothetical protein [Streptomyces durocortorensis]MBM7055526.1 hypothetical protein [Streptomyces durocortorensis]
MPTPLMGLLLLLSGAAVPACALVVVLLLRNRPRPLPRIFGAAALLFGFSAASVYCCGWFSVTLGGPFPALCEDMNTSGAPLTSLRQDYWPLRNACVYADGSTVEHLAGSIGVLVQVSAGLAVALACTAAFLSRRRRPADTGRGSASPPVTSTGRGTGTTALR